MRGWFAGLAAIVAFPAVAVQPWSFGGALGLDYDGNPGNAHSSDDIRPTERIGAGVSATWTQRYGEYTALQLRGALDGEGDLRLRDLSYGRASARVRLLEKPGEGFYVPVLSLWTSGGYKASGSALRSGAEWRVGAYVSEPITTQVAARLGFAWTRSDSSSRVFDGQSRAFELGLDWAVLPLLSLYGEYRLANGPIVVSAEGAGVTPKSEHLYLQGVADRIEADPAFGDNWWAFRLDARTSVATLGANLPLSHDLSLDAQLRRAHSIANDSTGGSYGYSAFSYDRWIGGVSLLLRF